MDLGLLEEFRFDWEWAGKAARTVDDHIAALRLLLAESPEPDLGAAKTWVASTSYASVRRKRAQAIRAFGEDATVAVVDQISRRPPLELR